MAAKKSSSRKKGKKPKVKKAKAPKKGKQARKQKKKAMEKVARKVVSADRKLVEFRKSLMEPAERAMVADPAQGGDEQVWCATHLLQLQANRSCRLGTRYGDRAIPESGILRRVELGAASIRNRV